MNRFIIASVRCGAIVVAVVASLTINSAPAFGQEVREINERTSIIFGSAAAIAHAAIAVSAGLNWQGPNPVLLSSFDDTHVGATGQRTVLRYTWWHGLASLAEVAGVSAVTTRRSDRVAVLRIVQSGLFAAAVVPNVVLIIRGDGSDEIA